MKYKIWRTNRFNETIIGKSYAILEDGVRLYDDTF